MMQLWLKYTDENGEARKILVEEEKFAVGRHSGNDLNIANSVVSRQHLKIERFADVFVVSDIGSSYGTTLNGAELSEPLGLKNGDVLSLGGEFEIEVEIISDEEGAGDKPGASPETPSENAAAPISSPSVSAQSAGSRSSISGSIFYIAPLFGLLILTLVGGLFFVFSGNQKAEVADKRENDFIYTTDRRRESSNNSEEKDDIEVKEEIEEKPSSSPTASKSEDLLENSSEDTNSLPKVEVSSEMDKIERSSAQFLRRIAINHPNAFLTSKQQEIIKNKINQFKGSSALAENFGALKRNASQIEALAKSKNLKPQFLAAAALARIGNQRGDPAATAQSMAETLDNLTVVFGNELADDSLMVIAFYEQGVANRSLAMRDMVAGLTRQFPNVSSRQIRTIWFLKENGKISEAEFEQALSFLAIGTIMQNPKDFGVNAEAVNFQ